MTNLYNAAAERLWEKIEFNRSALNMTCVDFKKPFPWDQFCRANPQARQLSQEVERELNYGMSEFQGSWAVYMACHGADMKEYNSKHGTALQPMA